MTTALRPRQHKLYLRQRGLCYWCQHPFVLNAKPTADLSPTLDHLEPRTRGVYGLPPRRAVLAHRICNNGRHHGDVPQKIIEKVERIVRTQGLVAIKMPAPPVNRGKFFHNHK